MDQTRDIQSCIIGNKRITWAGLDLTSQRLTSSLCTHWTTKTCMKKLFHSMAYFFNPFSSTTAAKKMGHGSLSLPHTHTHTAGPFPIFAIEDVWEQIEVNVWEIIFLPVGFFHDHFKVFNECLSQSRKKHSWSRFELTTLRLQGNSLTTEPFDYLTINITYSKARQIVIWPFLIHADITPFSWN